jgi:crotonobetainyl-CoA:carnitine CoA-transferase CaiB-like acyl-CoA transferase
VADPQVIYNRSFQTVNGATGSPITLVNHPVRYDGKVPEVRLPPQKLGAQSEEVLRELGYDTRQLKNLTDEGVVGIPA